MFINFAWAQSAGQTGPAFLAGLGQFLPLVLVFAVFYFLAIRPQMRKAKEHRMMVEALKRGDKIVTSGGIIGLVTKIVDEKELQVEISEGVKVRIQRGAVAQVLTRAPSETTKE